MRSNIFLQLHSEIIVIGIVNPNDQKEIAMTGHRIAQLIARKKLQPNNEGLLLPQMRAI